MSTSHRPAFASAVDLYTGLHADGSVPKNGDFDQTQGFISGIAPMLVSGPYLAKAIAGAAPELDGKWGITTLPKGRASGTSLFAGLQHGRVVQHRRAGRVAEAARVPVQAGNAARVVQAQRRAAHGEGRARRSDASLPTRWCRSTAAQLADAKVLPMVSNWDGGVGSELLKALNSIVLTGADRDSALAKSLCADRRREHQLTSSPPAPLPAPRPGGGQHPSVTRPH